jgi:transcriptional regulator of NAD metabolism
MTDNRRNKIIDILSNSQKPVKGQELSEKFDVSRQVIVQDIAVIRASGISVMATSNGYIIKSDQKLNKNYRSISVSHTGVEEMYTELETIIDFGGKIIDITVEHPVYGEINCPLYITSRYELDQFIEKVKLHNAAPLSTLTDGLHIHTIEVPSEEIFTIIKSSLKSKGILVEE